MGYERSTGRYYRDEDRRPDYGARDGRDDLRERSWRDGGGGYDHSRDYYRSRDGQRPRDVDDDRGFFDRAGDEVRSWFGDEEAERRRRWDERLRERDEERRYSGGGSFGGGGGYGGARAGAAPSRSAYARYGSDFGAGHGAGATSNWGLGAGVDHDGWGLDPNYHAWRRRQLAELDNDYADYRRENESRFNSEFGSWRSNRQGQRQSLSQVKEHQEVLGSDGTHVGTVDHVRGDRILLTRGDKDAAGHHHSVPCSWIAEVGNEVRLNRTAAQAQTAWQDEERDAGPHYLNRAFSGTY